MAFPINPNPGDTYTDEYGTVWVYAGPINGWYRQTVIPVNDTTYIGSDGAPGGIGNNTEVVFNDNGSLASDSGLTYNKTTDALSGGAFVPTGSTVPSNGVYRPSANNVAISTNGTGRLFVDSSGNVGAGLSNQSSYYADWNQLVVGAASGSKGITIATGSSDAGTLAFADGTSLTDRYRGYIQYAHGTDSLAFATGATERLRITSDGKLGLGTSSPVAKLDVNGSIRFADSGIVGPIDLGLNDTTQSYYFGLSRLNALAARFNGMKVYNNANGASGQAASRIGFFTDISGVIASTERLTITEDGKVGIGTATPGRLLQVSNTSTSPFISILGAASNDGGLLFGDNASDGSGQIRYEHSVDAMYFVTALSERARIDSSGRLLVGTSSSNGINDDLLQVITNVGVTRYAASTGGAFLNLSKSRSATTGTNSLLSSGDALGTIQFNGADGSSWPTAALIKAEVDATPGVGDMPGRLVFSTTADGASSPTERMRIGSNGKATFTLAGGSLSIGGGTEPSIYRDSSGMSGLHFSNGNILPTDGAGTVSDNTIGWGAASYRWSVIYAATGTINTSDVNLKQDIESLNAAELSVASAIKTLIRKFRFTNAVADKGDDARIHVGVIAQEVEQAFVSAGLDPRRYGLFCEDELEDGTKRLGIRYDELLAFVIAAL
ncbi:hypothetical protein S-CBP4_0037 [Synechococcus phage S-CBP4]|uniref:Peptidase S74 domain-containing protein n=1 Tax=Synechococcus phage S-CBP4 TaxID=754059 RepID=M1PRW7_9CAUD|nr:tail fiber protein [Synechococcus phage S-CBP4]YP_009822199.1 tail fiber protein [Synechococcus phage S-CBP4]AGF91699.1 hypothetical protein SVPG_00016 [Synechococcus phage S-CBP4]AGK86644.1 hypothetical protein S-CBP4_0037 [Synechococcus phage S-CBP4]